ncbi:GM21701 [Drosophila sechellia]|uniref:GM21701 n=1 Tax=Drosophila sechellia TaxID=7238 RepID=B4HSY6_DROSE|nr:GM21701 [Drosophila sechellia]
MKSGKVLQLLSVLLFLEIVESTKLLDSKCMPPNFAPRIIGGQNARRAPWMAYLIRNRGFVGGGSLIAYRFVLTAAHCSKPNVSLIVRLGEYDLTTTRDGKTEDFRAMNIYRHPYYNAVTEVNDIALLKLDRPVIYTGFVLTAAHCFRDTNAKVLVRLGENDASQKFDCNEVECADQHLEFMITQKLIHPLYRTAHYYDIALAKLNRYVTYTDSIRPICLMLNPNWQGYLDTIRYFIITGWGATNASEVSDKLQLTRIPQIDRFTCRYRFGYMVDRTHICAGESKYYVGKGDSGGPLGIMLDYNYAKRFFQFGIVSHLRQPFQGVSVFTNILSYSNWILRTIILNSGY